MVGPFAYQLDELPLSTDCVFIFEWSSLFVNELDKFICYQDLTHQLEHKLPLGDPGEGL